MSKITFLLDFVKGHDDAWDSQVMLVIKNPPNNAGDIRAMGSIPGLGISLGGGHGNSLLQCFAWSILWTEEPEGLQFIGSQRVGHD